MSLQNRLLGMAGKIGDALPLIEARQEKEERRKELEAIMRAGRMYAADTGIREPVGFSNQFLIDKGLPYSPKSAAIQNATFYHGGITGDRIESPFSENYGDSHQIVRPNTGFKDVRKALSLLVTSDQYRKEGRVGEAACLVEFSKYFVDNIVDLVGDNPEQRWIHFGSDNPQVHSSTYEMIGNRALRVAEKALFTKNGVIAKEMYELAKDCLEKSTRPIDQVRYTPQAQTKAA